MVFEATEWSERISEIYLITRRLANTLTTARLYIDQARHDLSAMYGSNSPQANEFEAWTHNEYDSRLGYRVMEALRNFMQHRGLPVSSLSVGWQRRELPAGSYSILTANPKLDVADIKEQGGFKASVLSELENAGDNLPLKALIRDYIEGLAAVHQQLEGLLETELPSLQARLAEVEKRFRASVAGEPRHLGIVARGGDGYAERHDIFDEPLKRLVWLAKRSSQSRHVASHLISSEDG